MFNFFKTKNKSVSVDEAEALIQIMDANKSLQDRKMRAKIDNYRREAYTQMMKDHYKMVVNINRTRICTNATCELKREKQRIKQTTKDIVKENRRGMVDNILTSMFVYKTLVFKYIARKASSIKLSVSKNLTIMKELFMYYVVRESLHARAKRYGKGIDNPLSTLERIIKSNEYTETLLNDTTIAYLIDKEKMYGGVTRYYVSEIINSNPEYILKLHRVSKQLPYKHKYAILSEIFDYIKTTTNLKWFDYEEDFNIDFLIIAILMIGKQNIKVKNEN